MFSMSRNLMKLFLILCHASGSQKSKMAAHKQGILISQLENNVAVQLQPLYQCFIKLKNSDELLLILCNASGRQQNKITVKKPEILIYQFVYNLATEFQRLYPYFQGSGIQ